MHANTRARCTRRCGNAARARARSAAWRSSPSTSSLEEQPNDELLDMSRRFWWSLALTAADSRLHGVGVPARAAAAVISSSPRALTWIELVLATPVVLWGGWPFFERGWASIVSRSPEHVHADRARRGRGVSLQRRRDARARPVSRLVPRWTARSRVYFEPAAVIVVLVLLGQVLELRARSRTSARDSRPARARAEDGARGRAATAPRRDVPLEHVHVGDRLRVRPGERVPVDGVVIEGASDGGRVDGHRRADAGREDGRRRRSPAARSTAPARFVMEARRVGSDTLLAQIVRMVERGAALARADSAARRHGVGVVRAGGHRRRGRDVRRCGRLSGPSRGWPTRSSTRSPS